MITNKKEDIIRGAFSFLAAGTLLYMSAEYYDYTFRLKQKEAFPIATICLGLAIMEANKVGNRAERILGLR